MCDDVKVPYARVEEKRMEGSGGRRHHDHRWLTVLTVVTVIDTFSFVAVTLITFLQSQNLDSLDAALRTDIALLERRLGGAGLDRSHALPLMASDGDRQSERTLEHSVTKRQSGLFIDMLKAQEAIIERHCQDKTKVCPVGPLGDKGHVGDTGAQGGAGQAGFHGNIGPPGPQGNVGSDGSRGDKGSGGDAGVGGPAGGDGVQGPGGDPGLPGLQGQAGIPGAQGAPGQPGEAGDGGAHGPRGYTGAQGQQGAQGPAGQKGPQGEAGLPGTKGPDAANNQADCDCIKLPKFADPSEETVRADLNGSYSLPCSATGNPPPSLSVTKVPAPPNGKRSLQHTATTAHLERVDSGDYGRYVCTAMNMYGSVTKYVDVIPTIHKVIGRRFHTDIGE